MVAEMLEGSMPPPARRVGKFTGRQPSQNDEGIAKVLSTRFKVDLDGGWHGGVKTGLEKAPRYVPSNA